MPTKLVHIVGTMTWEEEPASQPPGIWGGGNVPMPSPPIANVPGAPGYNPPGNPPGIWGPPGPWPTPPIHLPPGVGSGRPPGIWGGGNVPMPTPPIANVPGAPGFNPNPPGIWGPPGPWPTPPIHLPGGGLPGNPPGIWGGPGSLPPWAMPPIFYPPGTEGPTPLPPGGVAVPPAAGVPIEGKLMWLPGYGYVFVPDTADVEPPSTVPETGEEALPK